jgi:hypothetical protein
MCGVKWNELLAKKKELEEKKKARREKREQKKGGEKITGEKKSQDAATPSVRLPPLRVRWCVRVCLLRVLRLTPSAR